MNYWGDKPYHSLNHYLKELYGRKSIRLQLTAASHALIVMENLIQKAVYSAVRVGLVILHHPHPYLYMIR